MPTVTWGSLQILILFIFKQLSVMRRAAQTPSPAGEQVGSSSRPCREQPGTSPVHSAHGTQQGVSETQASTCTCPAQSHAGRVLSHLHSVTVRWPLWNKAGSSQWQVTVAGCHDTWVPCSQFQQAQGRNEPGRLKLVTALGGSCLPHTTLAEAGACRGGLLRDPWLLDAADSNAPHTSTRLCREEGDQRDTSCQAEMTAWAANAEPRT